MSDFEDFDLKPYKSASIGQVHKAKLKTGKDVVVKIKRPNIYEILKTDTDNVLEIVRFFEWIGIDTGTGTGIALEESVDYLLGEADYVQEIDNAVTFRKGMKGVSWIKVPKVYKKLSNQDRIVMEYVESTKVTELTNKKINKKKVCEAIINSYLIQTMDKGFFHGDPHPGNLGISEKTGKLVFYDFGLLINISERLREGFTNILIHIINKDTVSIVNELVEMGVIVPTSSELSDIASFFRSILNYLETLDGGVIVNDDFAVQLAEEKPFTVPSSFIYLAKSFGIIEGICKELDPDFNYFTYLEPMIQDEIEDAVSLGEMITTTTEMPSRVRDISTAVLGLEKSRAQMKRMMNKTGREVRFAQYSILVSILAAQTEHTPLTILCVATSIWLTMSSQK
jgi:predicted unusual protein kinase regulating ubiquinone biosynthesis (AarF/ABC1/UbiB family)